MPSKHEVAQLRDDITEEVNRDAEVLGTQLFAASANQREPDLKRVSDEQLRGLYRQKYLEQDRQWLANEAVRDPKQFIKVARQIGVVLPDEMPTMQPSPSMLPLSPTGESPNTPPAAPQPPVPLPGPAGPVDPNLLLQAQQQALAGPSVAAPQLAAQPQQLTLPM